MKLESTNKITEKFETIKFAFVLIILLYISDKQARHEASFFNCFVCLYSLPGSTFPRCIFIKLKACNQI